MKLLPVCHRHQRPRQIPCSWRSARDSADRQRCGRWRASSDSASQTRAFGAGEFVPWEFVPREKNGDSIGIDWENDDLPSKNRFYWGVEWIFDDFS